VQYWLPVTGTAAYAFIMPCESMIYAKKVEKIGDRAPGAIVRVDRSTNPALLTHVTRHLWVSTS
jgi:hypothetical protein